MNMSDTMHVSHCMVRTATGGDNVYIYDNDVLVGCYNVWQEKVVALSIPGCSAWLKCPKCTSDTVELPMCCYDV